MIRNYFAIALRNIRQNLLYSLINVFSLAIGLVSCLVIYLFITDEQSFDAFHHNKASVYRLDEVQSFTGTNVQKVALNMGGMGPAMLHDYPEVATFTRFWSRDKQVVKKGEAQFLIDQVAVVDSTFFDVFDFELIAGDENTALDQPKSLIVTKNTALKFFKTIQEALGNSLTVFDEDYKITCVVKNTPENSHLQFDALISISTFIQKNPNFNSNWGGNFLNTYLQLQPNTDIKNLESKFPEFMIRHTGDKDIGKFYKLYLQSLTDVHLGSTDIEHDYNNYRKFNGSYLGIFFIIGIFILLIASVNFMNLTTARASHRSKEIGVRKSIGAQKVQIFLQFIFESTLLALFALLLAFALALFFVPILNQLISRQLSLTPLLQSPLQILVMVSITILLGFLSGIYPSLYMTRFNVTRVLKGGVSREGRSIFRSSLVVLQFGLAVAMIVSTLIVVQQLRFMKNSDAGFNKDQILLVDLNQEANKKFDQIKTELLRGQFVQGVTAAGQRIGNNFHQWGFKVKTDTAVVRFTPSNVNVDYDYLKVYGIQVKDGRGFSKDVKTDNGYAFVVNEALVKSLGLKEPVGTQAGHNWYKDDSLGTIIGVVKDFNFNSMHHKINTLSLVVHPDWGYDEMSVKVDGAHAQEAIEAVKKVWDENVSSYPFTYSFLDQHFDNLYRSDQQMSSVVTIMASLAILISCMGLFGLVAITMERKVKEIGIRKTLGATEGQITFLLSKNFTQLIILAFILACPVTYYLLSLWLQSFAYRININLLWFAVSGLVALSVALLTISYHTIKSARANPVDALRYE